MKQHQVNKLYSKLTPHEQASLAFEAAMRIDDSEVGLILDSVERITYSGPHLDYQKCAQGLMNLSGVYGIVYWKTLCQLCALTALYSNDDNYNVTAQHFINNLKSMDAALEAVCKKFRVNVTPIKQFAECNDYGPDFGGESDNRLVELYIEMFSKIVNVTECDA